jgi:adenosylcobyric acid synthase
MLGKKLKDEFKIESEITEGEGFGVFDFDTCFLKEKKVTETEMKSEFLGKIKGYEIHLGRGKFYNENYSEIIKKEDDVIFVFDFENKNIGTYIHGFFDEENVRNYFIEKIAPELSNIPSGVKSEDEELDRLASHLKTNVDIDFVIRNLRF